MTVEVQGTEKYSQGERAQDYVNASYKYITNIKSQLIKHYKIKTKPPNIFSMTDVKSNYFILFFKLFFLTGSSWIL